MAPRHIDSSSNIKWWAISFVAALSISFGVWAALEGMISVPWRLGPSLTPTKIVYLAMTGEVPTDRQFEMRSQLLNISEGARIDDLAAFFNSEFTRYTKNESPALRIDIGEPEALVRGISQQPNAPQLLTSPEVFSFLSPVSGKRRLPFDAVIYLYFYPFDPNSQTNLSFPTELQSTRPRNQGLVFAPAHLSKQFTTLLAIAREVAFIFGAKNLYDTSTMTPEIPSGLVEPKKDPLFPQTQADIMAPFIATSALTKKNITGLKDLAIGPTTAYHLGWINRERLKELTSK